jgi:hypothetical protein
MPKVTIPKENFEEMDIYTQKYNVRYRIITSNQNNLSTWSPIFEVDPEFLFQGGTIEIPGRLFLDKIGGRYVAITWDSASIYKGVESSLKYLSKLNSYDVWIRWAGSGGANPSDWVYQERISATSLNINVPESYIDTTGVTRPAPKYMYVEVYRPGRPILRYEQTYEFPQNATTIDIVNNYINFGRGHGSNTGTPGLYLSATPIGGLTNNTTYYTRTIDYTTIALYLTKQNALDDVSRVDLTSTGSGTGSFTGFPFRLYNEVITTL